MRKKILLLSSALAILSGPSLTKTAFANHKVKDAKTTLHNRTSSTNKTGFVSPPPPPMLGGPPPPPPPAMLGGPPPPPPPAMFGGPPPPPPPPAMFGGPPPPPPPPMLGGAFGTVSPSVTSVQHKYPALFPMIQPKTQSIPSASAGQPNTSAMLDEIRNAGGIGSLKKAGSQKKNESSSASSSFVAELSNKSLGGLKTRAAHVKETEPTSLDEWKNFMNSVGSNLTAQEEDIITKGISATSILVSSGTEFSDLTVKERNTIKDYNVLQSALKTRHESAKIQEIQTRRTNDANAKAAALAAMTQEEIDAQKAQKIAAKEAKIRAASSQVIPLQQAQSMNIAQLHGKLSDLGRKHMSALDKTPPKDALISEALLRKLVQSGHVPKPIDMFQQSQQIKDFKTQYNTQLNAFLAEKIVAEDRSDMLKLLKNLNNPKLDLIIENLPKDITIAAPEKDNSALLQEIQKGVKLKKTQKNPSSASATQIDPLASTSSPTAPDPDENTSIKDAQKILGERMAKGGTNSGSQRISLEEAKKDPFLAHLITDQQGKAAHYATNGRSGHPTLSYSAFKILLEYDILPTPEEMYKLTEPRPEIELILKDLEKINIAKLKDYLATKIASGNSEDVEELIAVIGNEDKNLADILSKSLTEEEADLLFKADTLLEKKSEQEASQTQEARIARSSTHTNAITKAKTNRISNTKSQNDEKENSSTTTNSSSAFVITHNSDEDSQNISAADTIPAPAIIAPTEKEIANLLLVEKKKQEQKEKIVKDIAKDSSLSQTLSYEQAKILKENNIAISEILGISEEELIENASNDKIVSENSTQKNELLYLALQQEINTGNTKPSEHYATLNLSSILPQIVTIASNNVLNRVGVAAGSEDDSVKLRGFWMNGLYGTSRQGSVANSVGYKGTSKGFSAGFDLGPNPDTIIGIAYSNLASNFAYKTSQRGDKIDSESHVLSLYGKTDLSNNVDIQGIISWNNTKLINSSKRLVSKDRYKTGIAKIKSKGHNAMLIANYKISTANGLIFIPNFGIKYSNQRDGAFNESGLGIQNMSMASKKTSSVSAIVGTKILKPFILSKELTLAPTLSISVENAIHIRKDKKIRTNLAWLDKDKHKEIDAPNANKVGYNVGGGLVTNYQQLEVVISYNYHGEKKYASHQGTLKLKLSF